jgi:hypothetical protein
LRGAPVAYMFGGNARTEADIDHTLDVTSAGLGELER